MAQVDDDGGNDPTDSGPRDVAGRTLGRPRV